jgi:hypothetical protein
MRGYSADEEMGDPTMKLDTAKVDEAALAMLYLTLHGGNRAWKALGSP